MSNESMSNYITDTPSEIAELLAENAKLKAELVQIKSELKESDETLMHYACYETQYINDNDAPCVRDGDGRIVDDYDYSQGLFKQFGKRARQRKKERDQSILKDSNETNESN
jgi:hypothetical protein